MSDRFECPPEHKHGENTTCRAAHHCKCDECREFATMYEFWRKRQGQLRVSAVGTVRRMHALQRLGWSLRAIAGAAGYSESWAHEIVRQRAVSSRTAAKVRAVYDELCMTLPPERSRSERASVGRTRRYAERAGWPAPLAWDEDKIDDPGARPVGMEKAA